METLSLKRIIQCTPLNWPHPRHGLSRTAVQRASPALRLLELVHFPALCSAVDTAPAQSWQTPANIIIVQNISTCREHMALHTLHH